MLPCFISIQTRSKYRRPAVKPLNEPHRMHQHPMLPFVISWHQIGRILAQNVKAGRLAGLLHTVQMDFSGFA